MIGRTFSGKNRKKNRETDKLETIYFNVFKQNPENSFYVCVLQRICFQYMLLE